MRFSFSKLLAASAVLVSTIYSSADAFARIEGTWIQHPAATLRSNAKESQIDRIIEGERYVYFSVRAAEVDRSQRWLFSTNYRNESDSKYLQKSPYQLKEDPISIFRYDKTQPWAEGCLTPLAQELELSGSLPVAMNYSPDRRAMAVAYDNNAVDFIYDDGYVIPSTALFGMQVPSQTVKIYSFTFDEEKPIAYVAGSFGFAAVNMLNGELESLYRTDREVAWAGRVGENFVIFAGDIKPTSYASETYIYPVGNVPSVLVSPIDGGTNLQALMPVSPTAFAALARGASDVKNTLKLFTISDGQARGINLSSEGTVDNGAAYQYRHQFRTDGYFSPTRDGYAVYDNANILLIKKGEDAENVKTVSKSGLTTNEAKSKCATYDGSRFWLFTYESNGMDASERGFYSRDNSGNSWGEKSALIMPNAPTSSTARYGDFSPTQGFVIRGPGSCEEPGSPEKDKIFTYRDGKWTDVSFMTRNAKYQNPVAGAKYAVVDPLNPDWIWGSTSVMGGLFRMDLSNPSDFFAMGSTNYNNWKTTYPGFFPIFKHQPAYASLTQFSKVDFDRDGTMWFTRYLFNDWGDYWDYEDYIYAHEPLYYMTAEERQKINGSATDQAMLQNILNREISVPRVILHQNMTLKALKTPGNENLIVVTHGDVPGELRSFVYDHNGTPADQTDDRWMVFDELYAESGEKALYIWERGLYEDLKTGEVWMLTNNGPYIFDPKEYMKGNKVGRRPQVTLVEGSPVTNNPLEELEVWNVTDDLFGRKWISTSSGLLCLSPDSKELLGTYNASNSPLPSDEVYNVIADPNTGVLMVLTARGIVEFRPEGSTLSLPAGSHLTVWPSSVAPHFSGYVNIAGAQEGQKYEICDSEGKTVATLGAPEGGKLQWNVCDSDGRRVAAGRYSVKRVGMEENHPVIVL